MCELNIQLWMLREAIHCGVELDAVGFSILPAIRHCEPIREAGLLPEDLIAKLKTDTARPGGEAERRRSLRAQFDARLPHAKMVAIVELAARFDTSLGQGDDFEPHCARWAVLEDVMWGGRQTNPCLDILQQRLGPLGPGPVGKDLTCKPEQSLTMWWRPLEWSLLQQMDDGRRTLFGGLKKVKSAGTKYKWTFHLGRPRAIQPGQAIHRSVQKRLRHDTPAGSTMMCQIALQHLLWVTQIQAGHPDAIERFNSSSSVATFAMETFSMVRKGLAAYRDDPQPPVHTKSGDSKSNGSRATIDEDTEKPAAPRSPSATADHAFPPGYEPPSARPQTLKEAIERYPKGYHEPRANMPDEWFWTMFDWDGLRHNSGGDIWED